MVPCTGQHAPNQGIPCRIGRFLFRHLKNAGYEGRSWRQLLRDLTINVTQFFRDEAVFRALEDEVLPLLIYRKVKRGETSIRIWSAGCSSGQEPYSRPY
ncbi:MAG TPA: CheR family methyltransferase [Methanomassiliicoccaceae archaeon]|nr:CheR family methyltransferase [Methanomassiliicoccaceae archaeon]